MKILISVALTGAVLLLSGLAEAREGTEGKDWATRTIRVAKGAVVRVTASNYSKTLDNGNTSTVRLYVNGEKKGDNTSESENAAASYTIEKDGVYELEAICSNKRARQERCSINVEKTEIETFE
jgi:hypothetical protein